MIGQMTIDDFLCENEPFSWDADINKIYEKMNQLAKRYNLKTREAEWSVWDHVPQYGYRMSFTFIVGKCMEQQEDFVEDLNAVCNYAKDKNIELCPMWGAVWWNKNGTGDLTVYSTFLDKERKRRMEYDIRRNYQ